MLIDLYELTMAASFFEDGRAEEQATFDLFVRRLPPKRNYMVFAGLPTAVEYVESLHFETEDIEYFRSLHLFSENFLSYLAGFRFSGRLESLEEGEIFFGGESVMKITGSIVEAQIIETRLMNIIHTYSLMATKAARVVTAAQGKNVIDFGARRSHGSEAAQAAAYSSYLVGAQGTSNVYAGKSLGIPVFGTMAHSFVQSFPSEMEAFKTFLNQYPKHNTLLIDTYDPLEATRIVGIIAREQSSNVQAVRLDSGNPNILTKKIRKILDENELTGTNIILSGDLDEYKIADFIARKLPIDGFGVGTRMDTSTDAPYLEMVYKLSSISRDGEIRHTMKKSPYKKNLPGQKQIYRQHRNGIATMDIISLADEKMTGTPLLHTFVKNGRSVLKPESWKTRRQRFEASLKKFPAALKSVDTKYRYKVAISDKLQALIDDQGVDRIKRSY